ncbi:MAG: serine hydrolase [Anaerolineae bacterium]|jgi:CubicO group peptidase (beta-lactamase class C family)
MSAKQFKTIAISAVIFLALVGCGTTEGTEVISESQSTSSEPVYNPDAILEIGSIDPEVDTQIRLAVEEGNMPSLSVGVIVGGELAWAKSYGTTPAGIHTAYEIGSIGKTFTGVAILQLYERGLLDLDADINDYLPFTIRHPDHPDSPITVRMLLNHTSGLSRVTDDYNRFVLRDHAIQDAVRRHLDLDLHELNFDRLYERGEFYEAYLVPAGTFYSDGVWAGDFGSYEYSNIGFGLLAYIVECVSGQSFEDYLDQNIFQPLEMDESSSQIEAVRAFLANPYERVEGKYLKLPYRDIPFYRFCKPYQLGCLLRNMISPVGQIPVPKELEDQLDGGYLRFQVYENLAGSAGILSNVPDLAAYLATHMNEGRAPNGYQLLQPDTMALMHELAANVEGGYFYNSFPMLGVGLGWTVCENGIQGHIGGAPGYGATMLYQETTQGNVGIILLRNWSWGYVTDNDRVMEYGMQYYLPLEPLLFEAGRDAE